MRIGGYLHAAALRVHGADGEQVAYSATLPSGERHAPFDTMVVSGAYTEIMELSEASMAMLQLIQNAHLEWDGTTDRYAQWIASIPERRLELRIFQRSRRA